MDLIYQSFEGCKNRKRGTPRNPAFSPTIFATKNCHFWSGAVPILTPDGNDARESDACQAIFRQVEPNLCENFRKTS